ncbi:MAG TPA: alpha/beta fold hydrolase [Gemmatimonadales bacterium]|nr:alpha/beta fold hydrolase [Gemmatimonadales bacterium]
MLDVIERGTGPRVVMVHGDVFGAEMTWAAQQPLADRYHLLLVNRRGFGASPDVEAEDFAVDAEDIVEVLGDGAHLVGHSYGGVVSLLAAAAHPDKIHSLVVVEPPAFALTLESDQETRAFVGEVKALLASEPAPEDFLRTFVKLVGGDPSRLPPQLPPPLLKAASVQMKGRWPWDAIVPLDKLATTSFPKLVISGGHSHLFDAVCDVLEQRLPAQRVVLPGAGHSIPTVGEPFNRTLESFWGTVDTPATGATR